jgi:hypothetical protein
MKELCLLSRLIAEARAGRRHCLTYVIGMRNGILIRNPLTFFCYDKDTVFPRLFLEASDSDLYLSPFYSNA